MIPGRRDVFQMLAAMIATVAIRRRAAAASDDTSLVAISSMEFVGRAYLAEYGTSQIIAALAHDPALEILRSGQSHSMLLRRAKQDFADGNIVLVDGWMLSRTEAHICALAALQSTASDDQ